MLDKHHGWNLSFKPTIIGFVISILLTLGIFRIVDRYHLTDWALTYTIFGFAFAQAILQLVFFFHLGFESKPHWNTITFLFVVMVIVIVIGGSLWIMNNLNYNVMPPMEHGAP